MGWAGVLGLVVAAAAIAAAIAASWHWRERRRRQRRDMRARLAAALDAAGAAIDLGEIDAPALTVRDSATGAELSVPWQRLAGADCFDALGAGLRFQFDTRAQPHHDPLQLNKQARNLAPLVVRREWLSSFPDGPPPHTDIGDSGLCVIYRFLDSSSPRAELLYLSRQCLDATGLDVEGLQDAMVALLRQRFDEDPVRQLGRGEDTLVIEDAEAISTSYLFVIPELVESGEELIALVPCDERLVVAAAGQIDAAVRQASRRAPPPKDWLLAGSLRIDSDGIRLAKASRAGC